MRHKVFSGSPYEKSVGFCRAMRIGNRIEVAGTAPVGPDGQSVAPGDAFAQAMCCLEKIAAAIAELGGGMADVVRTRMYITGLDAADDVSRAHGSFFATVQPVATMVVVAGLLRPEWQVEIEAEAIVDD